MRRKVVAAVDGDQSLPPSDSSSVSCLVEVLRKNQPVMRRRAARSEAGDPKIYTSCLRTFLS